MRALHMRAQLMCPTHLCKPATGGIEAGTLHLCTQPAPRTCARTHTHAGKRFAYFCPNLLNMDMTRERQPGNRAVGGLGCERACGAVLAQPLPTLRGLRL